MAATSTTTDVDLDWISRGILVSLNDNGGTATTTEIKRLTGVTEGTKVPYRLKNKLAPADLIELTRRGVDENGRSLPLKAALTDQGTELAQQLDEDEAVTDIQDVTDHTDKLDAELNQLRSRVTDLEAMVQNIEESLHNRQQIDDQVADSLEELDERLQSIEQNMTTSESTSGGGEQ